MRAALFLLVSSAFIGSMVAQYSTLGCTRQVTFPSAGYTVPSYQPQCQCQCYQASQPPRVTIVPYNQYCQPQILQQNIVPQPPTCYQAAPIIVPIPAPPKDCTSASCTVTTAPPPNVTQPMSSHPPICVQTVYVAKDIEEDKKEEKKKCDCKKKKKDPDHEPEPEDEDRTLSYRKMAYYKQQMKRRQILKNMARMYRRTFFDPIDSAFDPFDTQSSLSEASSFDPLFFGEGDPSSQDPRRPRGFSCDQCRNLRGSGPKILFVNNQ